jgi:hypothetical protein
MGWGCSREATVEQVDDRVDGDAGAAVVVVLLAAVPGQAALRDLDDLDNTFASPEKR